MRFFSLVALGCLALGLSTIGCSADAQDDGAASATSDVTVKREVVATESDEGTTVQVTEGDLFTLELGANATTGYKWKVTKTNRTFAYPISDEYQGAGAGGPIGAGGKQVLTWSTEPVSDAAGTPVMSKVGKHQLVVEYRRPFEPASTPAAKTFKITVEVVAPVTEPPPPPAENDKCGDSVCGPTQECQWCWGAPQCIPRGAIC